MGKNKQTTAQKEFELKAMDAGYHYAVCRSVDEFMDVVKEYLNG